MKKALMNASVASMIYKFNMNNIEILEELGYQVDVACNFGKENPISQEQIDDFKSILQKKNIKVYETACPRSIFAVGKMINTYRQLKTIADEGNYDLVHTQSPIGGVICRLAFRKSRKKGTKVIYQAHGFHFFKGAPLINWVIFYPIEKFCSRFTDILITINKEDYIRAKKHFYTKNIEQIPGVGVDVKRFKGCLVTKSEKRKELSIPDDAYVLLSVGELSARKNHQVVIKALGEINDTTIYYLIAGKGKDYDYYKKIARDFGIENHIVLLGDRMDIDELCVAADVFVHPSIREGLGIAPLEGMASGLPLISSYVNGIKDYTKNGVSGICITDPLSVKEMKNAVLKMKNDKKFRIACGMNNTFIADKFSLEESRLIMEKIYRENEGGGYYHLIRVLKRKELGLKSGDRALLSVGELNRNKNHKIVIKALKYLSDARVHYYIVGEGTEEERLKSLAKKENISRNVHLLGYRTDVKELLFAADIFCFPSKREGLGLAAIEAMSSGVPIITSNIHGIRDYSINNETGFLCESNDVDGFVLAIGRLCEDDGIRYKCGKNAMDIAKKYSIANSDKRMTEIYEQVS